MTDKHVSDWAGTLREAFLLCRDLGHTWKPYTARYDPQDRYYVRTLRCARCRTERVQDLSMSGMIARSHYVYPEGYQAPAGFGHLTGEDRGALRAESVSRYLEKRGRQQHDG